jgi:starvation-inducible DNA-binding protein
MSHTKAKAPRQATGTVRANPLGLGEQVAEEMVGLLNADLGSMFTLYHQYHKHHWIVEGAQYLELHLLLEAHYTELHTQFDTLAERIVSLGGLPVAGPTEVEQASYVQHEAPGLYDLRAMLEHDVEAEGLIAQHLRQHIQAANQLGDYGSESLLKTILEAGEKRAAFLQKHLQPESLTRHIPVQ